MKNKIMLWADRLRISARAADELAAEKLDQLEAKRSEWITAYSRFSGTFLIFAVLISMFKQNWQALALFGVTLHLHIMIVHRLQQWKKAQKTLENN